MTSYRSKVLAASGWIELFHGSDIDNLQKLKKEITILTPEEKRHLPSTGLGKIGLSTTTDKNVAQRYSQVFGSRKIMKLFLKDSAKVFAIDSKGQGIDETLTDDELLDLQAKGYDAVSDLTHDEKEYRLLNVKNISLRLP